MAALAGFRVIPEARRPREGLAGRPASPIIGDDLEDQVATLPLESLPSLLAEIVKDAVERRVRYHEATGSAPFTRLDNRQIGAPRHPDSLRSTSRVTFPRAS